MRAIVRVREVQEGSRGICIDLRGACFWGSCSIEVRNGEEVYICKTVTRSATCEDDRYNVG